MNNKGYKIGKFMAENKRSYRSRLFHTLHGDEDDKQENTAPFGFRMLADVFSPFQMIGKDFIGMFHRFEKKEEWVDASLTPVHGLVNIASGIVFAIGALTWELLIVLVNVCYLVPLIFCASLGLAQDTVDKYLEDSDENLGLVTTDNDKPVLALFEVLGTFLVFPFMELALGITTAIQGMVQLLMTPLVYGIQLPIQALLTMNNRLEKQEIQRREINDDLLGTSKDDPYLNDQDNQVNSSESNDGVPVLCSKNRVFSNNRESYPSVFTSEENDSYLDEQDIQFEPSESNDGVPVLYSNNIKNYSSVFKSEGNKQSAEENTIVSPQAPASSKLR